MFNCARGRILILLGKTVSVHTLEGFSLRGLLNLLGKRVIILGVILPFFLAFPPFFLFFNHKTKCCVVSKACNFIWPKKEMVPLGLVFTYISAISFASAFLLTRRMVLQIASCFDPPPVEKDMLHHPLSK